MDATDLCFTPVTTLASLVRTKVIAPVEAVRAVLQRIDSLEPRLNAFALLAAEQAVIDGQALGRLHGAPIPFTGHEAIAGHPNP